MDHPLYVLYTNGLKYCTDLDYVLLSGIQLEVSSSFLQAMLIFFAPFSAGLSADIHISIPQCLTLQSVGLHF